MSPCLHYVCLSHPLGPEQDQLPCGPTEVSSDNCYETETRMVLACHMLRQLPKTIFHGILEGGRRILWSAKEMLDGQRQRADDISACAGPAQGVLAP